MKARILSLLKGAEGPVSGQAIGEALGVSRVAVFKQVGKLRELGYEIVSTPHGYRLQSEPEALFPWMFPGRESRVHYFPETASTMDEARALARAGCPPFTVAAADIQTRGRGRLDRSWDSGRGGLYFTVVTRPSLAPDAGHQVLFTASLVLARLLKEKYGINARLKWPNDLLAQGKKIAGMLSEMEAEADRVAFVNVGIGVNVNNTVHASGDKTTSIKKCLGKPASRREILGAFLDAFEAELEKGDFPAILSRWKSLTDTLSRPVRIVTLRETVEGIAEDLDRDGALLVRLKNGQTRRIVHGDCFYA